MARCLNEQRPLSDGLARLNQATRNRQTQAEIARGGSSDGTPPFALAILVVDDDKDVHVYFQRVVKALGADIKLCTLRAWPARARCWTKASRWSWHLLISVLPDGDGVYFCRELAGRESFAI
jgi:hypothetical protein